MTYTQMLNSLCNMNDNQLFETFHDMEDVAAVERIADIAYKFVENYIHPEEEPEGQPEHEEWKDIDDARRAREYESDKGSRTNL